MNLTFSKTQFTQLNKFLQRNKDLNWLQLNLKKEADLKQLNWGKYKRTTKTMISLLQAYQRLYKIMPQLDTTIILSLLKTGIHSALQIAAMPQIKFEIQYLKIFQNNKNLMQTFYKSALRIRTQLLLQFMKKTKV